MTKKNKGVKNRKRKRSKSIALDDSKNEVLLSSINDACDIFGVQSSIAGNHVTPVSSMKVSIVYACVRLIAGAMAQMPLKVYEKDGAGNRQAVDDSITDIFNLEPTPAFSAATFWEYMYGSVLLSGDGFAVIIRNRRGSVEEVVPVSANSVIVEKNGNRRKYFVSIDAKIFAFDQDDILHIPGFGFDGMRSMSVIRWGAANSIGLEMAMEEYAGDFFEGGAHQSVAVIKRGTWKSEQKQQFREAWVKTYSGIDKKRYPLVLDESTDIKQLSINAKDGQLLEQREFQITDIARAFGLPSFMVNQEQKTTSFGSGIETIGIGFLRYTIAPHKLRGEQEVNRKIFKRSGRFAEFESGGLMRGTLKDRNDAHRQAVGGSHGPGWITLNEVRRMENRPPINNPLFDIPYHPALHQNGTSDTLNKTELGNGESDEQSR